MPNSVNNDNNEFSIYELQKKLVNIEETAMEGSWDNSPTELKEAGKIADDMEKEFV